uniref:RNA-binding protein 43 n=1 Tax=Centroberyx gerrardi TaxID=166262 RepID=UPI003AADDE82
MENQGCRIEVSGVPDVFPADRTVDKLLIHFLRPRHGGGEVLRVLYPSRRPGQAFVIFEEPEVAARILQRSHVLEVDNRQFPLTVKAADSPKSQVDLPVEATLHLSKFLDKAEVHRLLGSHGFVVTEQHKDQVRVKGSFTKLRAVKARLEELLNSQTQTRILSSGAVPKNYTNGSLRPDGNRHRFVSQDELSFASPSSPTSSLSRASGSPEYGAPQSPRRNLLPSARSRGESFTADADVLNYAQCFRKKDIDVILDSHKVELEVLDLAPGLTNVTLLGKSANNAMGKLQSILNDLDKTLRTQEITLADIDHNRQVDLAKRIQKYKDIYGLVLISQVNGTVRLIGPSADSYELKQRLLGMTVDQPAFERTGRTMGRGPKWRSSSMSKIKTKDGAERAPPAGARGYSPSRYRDDKGEGAEAEQGAGARPKQGKALGRRSLSESRGKVSVEKAEDQRLVKENKQAPRSLKKFLQSISPKEIKQKLKKSPKK